MNYADEIKNAVPMTEAAIYYGFNPNRAGYICCPFHNEKTPSLKIYSGGRGWHCYGCGEGGDVISFVAKYFNLNFSDAIAKINDDFRLGLPIGEKLDRRKQLQAAKADFLRKQERKRQQQKIQELDDAYWAAFDRWKQYDTWLTDYRPEFGKEINPLYIEAVKNIDKAAYKMEKAEEERDEYVREQHNHDCT